MEGGKTMSLRTRMAVALVLTIGLGPALTTSTLAVETVWNFNGNLDADRGAS